MIRKNPMKDVDNPPGQARYLRDVIRKYQEEEKEDRYPERHGTINKAQDTTPSTDAEKRLERLREALAVMYQRRLNSGSDKYEAGITEGLRLALSALKDVR